MLLRGRPLKIADTSGQDIQLEPPGKKKFYLSLGAAAIVLIAMIWVAAPWFQRWANATISVPMERVRVATVTHGDLVRDISIQGRVVAAVSPTLYATAPGSITLNVEAGERVLAGQVVATVDSPELMSRWQQAQSAFEQRQMELERQRIESRQQALEKRKAADLADVALIAARREKRRADQANEKGVIPRIDYEKAQDDLRNAELAYQHAVADAELFEERLDFELRASEFDVNRQKLLVEDLRRQVDDLSINSPVSGIVGDLLVDQKAAVTRDTPVMAVVDLSRFEVEASIPEGYADDLSVGMQSVVSVGGNKFTAQIVAVSPEIIDNEVKARLRFVGDEQPVNLRQNQRLQARILLASHDDVLLVQRGQFLDSGAGRVAYVIGEDGLATRRPIETGARSLGAVEIISGLDAGDQIVISNLDPFRSAERVRLTN
jgi:HlyD family secretion protein